MALFAFLAAVALAAGAPTAGRADGAFVSPGAFEGFGNLAQGVQLPSDLTPGSSQAYLAALGAARAAMEGQG